MKWNNSVARRFFHCPQLEVPFYLRCSDVELNSLYSSGMGSQTCYFVWRTRATKTFGHTSVLIKTWTDYTFSTFIVVKLTGAFSNMHPEVSSSTSWITTQHDWRHSTFRHTVCTLYIYLYWHSSLKFSNKCFFFSSGLEDLMLGYAGLNMQLGQRDMSRIQN